MSAATRAGDMAKIDTVLNPPPLTPEEEAANKQPGEKLPDAMEPDEQPQPQAAPAPSEPAGPLEAIPGHVGALATQAGEIPAKVGAVLSSTANDAKSLLERVSIPGSILLPVGLLVLFYFLIIPVNGYPRLAWLWLVITNNASLAGGTSGGGGGSGFVANIPAPLPLSENQPYDPAALSGLGGSYQGNGEPE